jgi:hypothetical protein
MPDLDELSLDRLVKRLVTEDCIGDEDFAMKVIEEYKRFFVLVIESEEDDGILVPSRLIDFVWQRHQLDTLNYFDDCKKFGIDSGYLHRHPLNSCKIHTLAGDDSDSTTTGSDCSLDHWYGKTKEAYHSTFGAHPPDTIWPTHIEPIYLENSDTKNIQSPVFCAAPWMEVHAPRLLGNKLLLLYQYSDFRALQVW